MGSSYKNMARKVQQRGATNTPNDSILAHITSGEAALLKARGGSGRTDPHTGLMHFDDGAGPGGDGMSGMSDGSIGGINGDIGAEGTFGNGFGTVSGLPGLEDAPDVGTLGFSESASLNDSMDGPPAGPESVDASADEATFGKFSKAIQSFLTNAVTGKAMSAVFGQAAPVAGVAMSGGKGPAAFGNSYGGALGGMLGTAVGGPLGGIAGSAIGSGLGGILGGVDNSGLNGQGPANASAAAANGSMGEERIWVWMIF
jgi:hypothetical protein